MAGLAETDPAPTGRPVGRRLQIRSGRRLPLCCCNNKIIYRLILYIQLLTRLYRPSLLSSIYLYIIYCCCIMYRYIASSVGPPHGNLFAETGIYMFLELLHYTGFADTN